MRLRRPPAWIRQEIAGPSGALAFAILALEWMDPGIVGRWLPVAPTFFILLTLAAAGALVGRPRA